MKDEGGRMKKTGLRRLEKNNARSATPLHPSSFRLHPSQRFTPNSHFLSSRSRNRTLHRYVSKILVIDDTLAASKLAESVLAQHFNGVDILLAQRGADAFERFNVAQPDVIILDESLPDMDTEAVCYRLLNEQATAKVPVILLASNGSGDAIAERYQNVLKVLQRPDPNGSPAYTRKGYELIQRLKLNDVEARFATAVNGAESLQSIAKKIGIPLNDALLIVFRFQQLEIIDYWNSSVLSLTGGEPQPA